MESSRAGGGAPAVAGESPGDQVTVFCGHHREASQHHPPAASGHKMWPVVRGRSR